jgi:hypothetical protein
VLNNSVQSETSQLRPENKLDYDPLVGTAQNATIDMGDLADKQTFDEESKSEPEQTVQ